MFLAQLIGRLGLPEEVASLMCWLLCDESRYIAGAVSISAVLLCSAYPTNMCVGASD
jgi:NAD(P)-dependent dehydrogenase (short-subunit alcohol dehydrogenase family)